MRQRIITGGAGVLIALALAACNSAGTASTAPASESAASTAPTLLLPSVAIPSGLPSVALPSPDPQLEAMLPDQLCGTTATKSSAAGGTFAAGNTEISAFLASLGKTSTDLSVAAEIAGTTGCSASILRIKGADTTQLHDKFVAVATQQGMTPSEKSVGGKTVLNGISTNAFAFAYFKDDTMIFFSAPDDTKAADVAAALP